MGATRVKEAMKQVSKTSTRCSYKVSTWDLKLHFLCFLFVFEAFHNGKYTLKLSKEPHEEDTVISISPMKKMKHREVQKLVQGHTAH